MLASASELPAAARLAASMDMTVPDSVLPGDACPHVKHVRAGLRDLVPVTRTWACQACGSDDSVWLCLHCGYVGCGRYLHAHAKAHYESSKHPIALELRTVEAHCYECDEFVAQANDQVHIAALREALKPSQRDGEESDDAASTVSISLSSDSIDDGLGSSEDLTDAASAGSSGAAASAKSSSTSTAAGSSSSSSSPSASRASSLPRKRGRSVAPRLPLKPPAGAARKQRRRSGDSVVPRSSRSAASSGGRASQRVIHPGVCGLRNLGNTCFMNAVLQCISNVTPFRNHYLRSDEFVNAEVMALLLHKPLQHSASALLMSGADMLPLRRTRQQGRPATVAMCYELQRLLRSMWLGTSTSVSPDSLLHSVWRVVPRFRGYQQQDAQEFLRYLLDRLLVEEATFGPGTSAVRETFQGMLLSEVECCHCHQVSRKHDPFLDLSLYIPQRFLPASRAARASTPVCHLRDCLAAFTEREALRETERYRCDTCLDKMDAVKQFTLRSLPNVLCLHLKRFRWGAGTLGRSKIDVRVHFPLTGLDLSQFCCDDSQPQQIYDLVGVIVHHGVGSGGGHYTAFAWNDNLASWIDFNDTSARCVDASVVAAAQAYVLFYRRRPRAASSS